MDSTQDIINKQLEIFLSKSESERFRIGEELNSFGRKVLESSIQKEYPGITAIDLKTEILKRCYSSFFSPEEFQRIINSMKDFLQNEKLLQL